jgi:hypothetical protein
MKLKLIAATMMSLFMLAAIGPAQTASASGASQTALVQNSETIRIARSESRHSNKGSDQFFTGSVQVQQLFLGHDPSRKAAGK